MTGHRPAAALQLADEAVSVAGLRCGQVLGGRPGPPTGWAAAGYQQSRDVRWKAVRALEAAPSRAANVPAVTEARELLALPSGRNA
jgi:hypothetical protein